jgi:hypothetical protein
MGGTKIEVISGRRTFSATPPMISHQPFVSVCPYGLSSILRFLSEHHSAYPRELSVNVISMPCRMLVRAVRDHCEVTQFSNSGSDVRHQIHSAGHRQSFVRIFCTDDWALMNSILHGSLGYHGHDPPTTSQFLSGQLPDRLSRMKMKWIAPVPEFSLSESLGL